MKLTDFTLSFLFLGLISSSAATLTWTGAGDGSLWGDSVNWSPASLPNSSSDVVFNSETFSGLQSEARTIASLSFNHLTGSSIITAVGDSLLQVNGSIVNASSSAAEFDISLSAGATSTWTGLIKYLNVVNFGSNAVTLSGSHTFAGNNLNFNIANPSSYGRLLGSFTSTAEFIGTITIDASAYVSSAVAGDTFDFTTGNFASVSVVNITPLTGDLVWNTANFVIDGTLSVSAIPEPSTYATLIGVTALGFCAVRHRRKV
jgi:hypothetical protein